MSAKRKKDPHAAAADELLNDDDGLEAEPGTEGESESESEPEPAPEPIRDGDDVPVEHESRRDRKRGRLVERILSDVDERIGSVLDRRLATLEQRLQQQPTQRTPSAEPQRDPAIEQIDARIGEISARQRHLSTAFQAKQQAGRLTDAEYEQMTTEAQKLQDERMRLVTIRTNREMGLGRAADPQEAARQAMVMQTRARHSDVYEHRDADAIVRYADGYFQMKVAQAARLGRQVNGPELLDESLDKAREAWGMQTRAQHHRRPDRAERSRFTGTQTSGGGSGGNQNKTVKITAATRAMADAAFPHIKDPNKRLQHWANTAGKRLVDSEE